MTTIDYAEMEPVAVDGNVYRLWLEVCKIGGVAGS